MLLNSHNNFLTELLYSSVAPIYILSVMINLFSLLPQVTVTSFRSSRGDVEDLVAGAYSYL